MGRKRHTPERIITALREAEVGLARGKSVKLISRELGITDQTYYRWRREYGGMKVSQARRLKELERENGRLKRAVADLTLDKLILEEAAEGNFGAPRADDVVWCVYVSSSGRRRGERAGCSGSPRTTQRRARKVASDEGALRGDIVRLASRFGRYGYRRVTDMLRIEGWGVKHKRVERIWRQEGLKVPQRQPKRGRLWLNDGSCIRLRPLYRGHVWSYDFVASRTHDGRALKLLTVLDEHTRESALAIVVARKIRAHDVLEVLADLFVRHGPPEYLRSDNGPVVSLDLCKSG